MTVIVDWLGPVRFDSIFFLLTVETEIMTLIPYGSITGA